MSSLIQKYLTRWELVISSFFFFSALSICSLFCFISPSFTSCSIVVNRSYKYVLHIAYWKDIKAICRKVVAHKTVRKEIIVCKCNIFFTVRSLFTIVRKVDTWSRNHVRWFATVFSTRFSFSSLIYINFKKFLKLYTSKHFKLKGKNNFDA